LNQMAWKTISGGSFLIRAKAWITPKLPVAPTIYILLPS
jgi:hypothetical protein